MSIVKFLAESDNKVLSRIGFWVQEIYRNRHLLFGLVEREFKGKYRNSVLGYLWHVIMPLFLIAVYLLVFTTIFGREIENYWAYLSVGVFSFTFFSQSATMGMGCIVNNKNMVTKMYFPREILVISAVLNALIAFVISYVLLVVIMAMVGLPMNAFALLVVPLIIMLEAGFALGVAFALSALTVYSRDLMYGLGRVIPLMMMVTPIFYLSNIDNDALQTVLWINPLTYFVEIFHDSMYWGVLPDLEFILVCLLFTILALLVGLFIFKVFEKGFAERL